VVFREGFGHCVILDEDAERARALTSLCVTKCSEMDLTNHKTAYNALKKIQQPHKDNLKRMGYCEEHEKNDTFTAQLPR